MLVRSKSNIGPDGGGFGYDFEQRPLPSDSRIIASAVLWGESLNGSARELLSAAESLEEPGERSATDEAAEALRELLAYGPLKASDAQSKLRSAGFSEKQIRSARERLGIKPKRSGFGAGGTFVWSLTSDHRCPENPIDAFSQREGNNDPARASMRVGTALDGEAF